MGKPRKVTKPHIRFLVTNDKYHDLVEKLRKLQFVNESNLLIITKKDYATLKEIYQEEDGKIKLDIKYYNQEADIRWVHGYFFVTTKDSLNT